MPSKMQFYAQMADQAAKQITGSYQSWISFLQTAGRLYKYPYNEQVMIHAQRPEATACAEYDFWNRQWGRYVRRGSRGIALIDTSGENPRLKYVFDVADTGTRENSRPVRLWELQEEYEPAIQDMLERSYGVSGQNGLRDQLEIVAHKMAVLCVMQLLQRRQGCCVFIQRQKNLPHAHAQHGIDHSLNARHHVIGIALKGRS